MAILGSTRIFWNNTLDLPDQQNGQYADNCRINPVHLELVNWYTNTLFITPFIQAQVSLGSGYRTSLFSYSPVEVISPMETSPHTVPKLSKTNILRFACENKEAIKE